MSSNSETPPLDDEHQHLNEIVLQPTSSSSSLGITDENAHHHRSTVVDASSHNSAQSQSTLAVLSNLPSLVGGWGSNLPSSFQHYIGTTSNHTNINDPTTTTSNDTHDAYFGQQQDGNDPQQQQSTTTATTTNPSAGNNAESDDEEEGGSWFDADIREVFFKVVPLVLLPGLLFMYFHFIGVITFLWLALAIFTVHERLKQQVALKEERSLWMSILLVIISGAHIALFYFFMSRYKPWFYLIFIKPYSTPLDFWSSLYFVVTTDCVLKLTCMMVKCLVVIVLGPFSFVSTVLKGRIYANIEAIFYAYRCCLPVPVWGRYMFGSTYHIAFSIVVVSIYAVFKLKSILESLWKTLVAVRVLFSSTAPFGRYATREEVLEVDDTCSICQDEFKKPICLHCGHLFCEECISTWFERDMTCPICRAQQKDVKLHHVDGSSGLGIFCL